MNGEESGRRSPSLERIDRPPSYYRPPIRSPASPRLSNEEVDELTNPNLPYRTGYTYAFSKSYRNSTEYDDYEVPNMAGTSFYHDSSMRDDDSAIGSSSFASTIYEETVTAYYKTITAIYCSLATTYAGGRSIVEWIYYILYSTAYGIWYVGSQGGRWIGNAIYHVLYSIGYALWLVLDATGRVSYNGSSLFLQTLFAIAMYIPRTVNGLINSPPKPKRVTYDDDENEVRYFAQNESVANGPPVSSSSSSSSSIQKSVFGNWWSSALKYLKRGRGTHMEPVYDLRSRKIEREVVDTDTDDELGIDEHINFVYHQPAQSIQKRRVRSTRQVNEADVIYDDSSSSNILTNIAYLPIDAVLALYSLICFTVTSVGTGVKNIGYYGASGAKTGINGTVDVLCAILYYAIIAPVTAVGSFVKNVASGSSSSSSNGVHHSVEKRSRSVHHTTLHGSAVRAREQNAAPVYSSHDRDEDEDILVDLRETSPKVRRSSRRLSGSSNSSDQSTVLMASSTIPSTSTARMIRPSRSAKSALTHSSSTSSSSSSIFAPVGGIVWAVKDSTTTIFARIIDDITFFFLFIYQCFRAVGQLIAGFFSAVVSTIDTLWNAVSSGTATSTAGIASGMEYAYYNTKWAAQDFLAGANRMCLSGGKAIYERLFSTSRSAWGRFWNLFLLFLLLLPIIFALLWFFGVIPFKKEDHEAVEEYVKHASSIMEDYYSFGQHHTKSFIGVTIDTIVAGARSLWTIFTSLIYWAIAAILGLWESLIVFLAGFRFFASPSSPSPVPIPIIVAPSSSECPPATPPVYIPAPPSAAEQEAMMAAIMARVNAQMEQRLDASLSGRMHVFEESVKRTEEELRATLTVAHEPIDYSNLDAMIAAAIRKYDSDKTGLVDYALESAGGQIVSTRCSETYALSTRVEKIFDIPLYYSNYGPRVVIQRNSQALVPGECWAFKGGIGYLTIKLAVPIKVTSVSYEHIPKSISRNGENLSAPKTFTIFAYEKDEYDFASRFELGKFTYDSQGDPLQFFPVQDLPSYPVQIIEFQVDSNYGEQYTCLYRFRVHGDNLSVKK